MLATRTLPLDRIDSLRVVGGRPMTAACPVTRAFFGVGGIGSTSGKDDSRAAPAG